jgi:hypothetical protein
MPESFDAIDECSDIAWIPTRAVEMRVVDADPHKELSQFGSRV